MAREKKLSFGAINITIQPHDPQKYSQLMLDAHKLRNVINLGGNVAGLLSSPGHYDSFSRKLKPLTGALWKFTQIDMSQPWVNTNTIDIASDDDLQEITIPEFLRPNGAQFNYIFYTDVHLLFYESYSNGKRLSPDAAEKFFKRIFSNEQIVKKYGEVEVTHIPDITGLEDALNIPFKKKIGLTFNRPNPDGHAKAEEKLLNKMKKRKIKTVVETYTAEKDESILMDDDLEMLSRVAAKNGVLFIQGRDLQGKPINYTTKSSPYEESHYYDPSDEPEKMGFLYRKTTDAINYIKETLTK